MLQRGGSAPWSVGKLQEVAAKLRDTVQAETRLLFVDDGSRDNTWNLIREYAEKYEMCRASNSPTTRAIRMRCGQAWRCRWTIVTLP